MSALEAVRRWLVAELSASAAVRAAAGSPPVFSGGYDLPSGPGVYVHIPTDRRRNSLARVVLVEVHCSKATLQGAFDLMGVVADALRAEPGEPKAWNVQPSLHNLSLRRIVQEDSVSPDSKPEPGSSVHVGVLVFSVHGWDRRRVD